VIEIRNVTKTFGDLRALDGVDLDVARGEVVCVIGPSGSGKSTLLRCVNALERPDSGAITVDGRPVEGLPCPSTAVVKGDSKSLLVASASVVAKVVRDARMRELDALYPQYGFAAHKGYGTSAHVQALFEHGPSPEHRRSSRPVSEAEAIIRRT